VTDPAGLFSPALAFLTGQKLRSSLITATEFRARCLEILDRVEESGEEVVITKRGRPVARVVPLAPVRPWLALRGRGTTDLEPGESAADPEAWTA
jgi:prevent-host-death family protein